MTAYPSPRSGAAGTGRLVLRLTGLLLSVLVLGHFALTHIVNDVAETDAAYVADRFSDALFVAWDAVMLWAAILHGAVGVWIVIGEHARRRVALWRRLLVTASATMAIAGSVILVVAR
jgi:succinate dehydrogenase / fumarate reductase membrane anchor subunit